jgi:hypothetical protein
MLCFDFVDKLLLFTAGFFEKFSIGISLFLCFSVDKTEVLEFHGFLSETLDVDLYEEF